MEQDIVLFDTDTFIDFLRGNPDIVAFVEQISAENVFISSITYAEVLNKAIDANDLRKLKKKIESIPTIPLDTGISDKFEIIWERYLLSHRPSIPDVLIASTCLYFDIPLFTYNLKDYHYLKEFA